MLYSQNCLNSTKIPHTFLKRFSLDEHWLNIFKKGARLDHIILPANIILNLQYSEFNFNGIAAWWLFHIVLWNICDTLWDK